MKARPRCTCEANATERTYGPFLDDPRTIARADGPRQGCILAAHPECAESRLQGCLFHIAVLAGLLEPRLNRRSAVFRNFVPPFP